MAVPDGQLVQTGLQGVVVGEETVTLDGPCVSFDLKRLSGVDVTQESRTPLVAYLGDSSPEGLDRCPAMFEAQVLITEMTFVAPRHRKERIHKYGHMHLDDIVERRDRFKNEIIIASHFSTRYHSRQVRNYVEQAFPDMLEGRLHLWL